MKTKLVIEIAPHKDGIHCGECGGIWVTGYDWECDQQGVYEAGDYVRGPKCLAAQKKYERLRALARKGPGA